MSYPRKLQVLIVEDDSDAIEAYRVSFATLKKKFDIVDPVIVRGFNDAQKRLEGPDIFHVVILDMNLPMETRGQPVEGLAPGEQLLETIAKRDAYPVPVVLIVSGKLNLAQSIGALSDCLTQDFWHGRLVTKGSDNQHQEIERGLSQALRYLDVGIHIRDAGNEWYPTLSPREKDLLRRCVLAQGACLGVDLRWWSAENGPSFSRPNPNAGPTKVLMGHFILDEALGTSLPTFFKFEPAGNAVAVRRDAGILAQKLGHIKVYHTCQSRQRSLIVTQSVTNRGWPVPLNEYLRSDPGVVGPAIATLINHVVEQLHQLGTAEDDEVQLSAFFWEHLYRDAIEKAWSNCDTRQLRQDGCGNPLAAFDILKAVTAKHWATRRHCTHGDLNATNVAIDATQPDGPHAYIFDAAGMRGDFDFRDLATLEVTSILFNSVGLDQQLIHACRVFYDSDFLPNVPQDIANPPFTRNVLSMIGAIRSRFQTDQQKRTYALLVFDAVLRQLLGLAVQPSPNKIKNPLHACYLAAWVSHWIKAIAPDWFPQADGQANAIPAKVEEEA